MSSWPKHRIPEPPEYAQPASTNPGPPPDYPPKTKSTNEHYSSCNMCGGIRGSRNISLCFDGTSNQFGKNNTNVVELYSRIIKDETQLTYYNSGIGTYARPSWRSLKYWTQVFDNKIDLLLAWQFEKNIIAGYRWLSENHRPGDKIFLFGFSRGAYQVRALAGMISKVGLIQRGNEEQIPFAYELFANLRPGRSRESTLSSENEKRKPQRKSEDNTEAGDGKIKSPQKSKDHMEAEDDKTMAHRFKKTFSRPNVKVHFVGVWDTVSSIGIVRDKALPTTDTFDEQNICYFRHALALDERRVKFLPEFVCGGNSYHEESMRMRTSSKADEKAPVEKVIGKSAPEKGTGRIERVKEVWFAGSHSDIGGGNLPNAEMNNAAVPVLWMGNEAWLAGLKLEPSQFEWDWDKLRNTKPKESLTIGWSFLEILPFKRLSYRNRQDTCWWPHMGKGRVIKPGQKIHASVAFIQNYEPQARFHKTVEKDEWERVLSRGRQDDFEWMDGIDDLLELDLFDHSRLEPLIDAIEKNYDIKDIKRLNLWASGGDGIQAIAAVIRNFDLFVKMIGPNDGTQEIQEIGKEILIPLLAAVRMLRREDQGVHKLKTDETLASLAKILKCGQDDITCEAIPTFYKFVQDDERKKTLFSTEMDWTSVMLEQRHVVYYGVLTFTELCTNENIAQKMCSERADDYIGAIAGLRPWNQAVGLAGVVLLFKHRSSLSRENLRFILSYVLEGIRSGNFLWNPYSAEVLRQVLENEQVANALGEQLAAPEKPAAPSEERVNSTEGRLSSSLEEQVERSSDAQVSGRLRKQVIRPNWNDIFSALFDAMATQPFAIDVFSSLVERRLAIPPDLCQKLLSKVTGWSPNEDDGALRGYLQALGQLARHGNHVDAFADVERLYEKVKAHTLDAITRCCFVYSLSYLQQRRSADEVNKDIIEHLYKCIGELDRRQNGRGTRWQKCLANDLVQESLKKRAAVGDLDFWNHSYSYWNRPVVGEEPHTVSLFDKHLRGDQLERRHHSRYWAAVRVLMHPHPKGQ